MHTTLDFETRSRIKLKKHGVAIYAMDKSTIALCLAYRVPGVDELQQWVWNGEEKPQIPDDLRQLVENEQVEFHAFNAPFERYIWTHVCENRWGWPRLDLSRWRCSMARAASANQPQSLDKLGTRLRLTQKKQEQGKLLIPLLTEPAKYKKPKKNEKIDPATRPEFYPWNRHDENCRQFLDYNKADVLTEEQADDNLPPMHPAEVLVWQMDRRMNERGFMIDVELCKGAKAVHLRARELADQEIARLSNGAVPACSKIKKLKQWLEVSNVALLNDPISKKPTLNEPAVRRMLASGELPEAVQDALTLRVDANSNTVTKYASALERVGEDGRVRESVRYYGAATGRWTGSGFHPHNFKREAAPHEDFFKMLQTGNFDLVEFFAEKAGVVGVINVLKQCVRGIITAPPGRKLITSDFAGIEARVLHWLCSNEKMLQLFRDDQDIYIAAACDIYDCKPEDIATWNGKKWKINKDCAEKRQIGKQAQLGLGYGMGGKKFVINVAMKEGLKISDEFADETVRAWRAANEPVVLLWHDVNTFAREIAQTPMLPNGKPNRKKLGKLKFAYQPTREEEQRGNCVVREKGKSRFEVRGYLTIELPSGRRLFYHSPRLVRMGEYMELFYIDGSKSSGKGVNRNDDASKLRAGEVKTYGGKLTENIVQAISRDLLVHSLSLIEQAGYEPIFHVHDESVTEVDDAKAAEAEKVVHKAMETTPIWAEGLPLMAETKVTQRYEK